MKRLLALFVFGSLLFSQSHIPIDQLRVRRGAPAEGVWVFYNGALVLAEVGEGIRLVVTNGRPVLKVTAVGPQLTTGADLTLQPDGSYLLPQVSGALGNLSVYRNGVRQKQGLDYALDQQNARRVIPLFPWLADDVLQADFTS